MFSGCTGLTSATIGDGIVEIVGSVEWRRSWDGMFEGCTTLITVRMGRNVTSIGNEAFAGCERLANMYFDGNAPEIPWGEPFPGCGALVVFYRPGTPGWGPTFGDRPTALWIPLMPNLPSVASDNPLRLVTHSPAPATVRVQRSTNLLDWEDWQTVSRDSGPSELQDTEASITPYRFYRGVEE